MSRAPAKNSQVTKDEIYPKTWTGWLEHECPHCKEHEGKVMSTAWQTWWRDHPNDWKAMTLAGNVPPEDEYVSCEWCGGTGSMPTNIGNEVLDFIMRHLKVGDVNKTIIKRAMRKKSK